MRPTRDRALRGATILVTRPRDHSRSLLALLRQRGGRPLLAPTVEIVPARSAALTRALRALAAGEFEWITLTSRATVDVLRARSRPSDVKANVAAIGDGTAEASEFPVGSGRVLCARADIAPPGLEDALEAKGWTPERVDAYRTRLPRSLPAEARAALRGGIVDAITFTSASTVRGFAGAARVVNGEP